MVVGLAAPALAAPAGAAPAGEDARVTSSAAHAPGKPACTIGGTTGDDVLVGTSGDDVICGRGGDDVLRGQGGDDVLRGGGGDDVLRGGAGDDVLRGWRGDDTVVAGPGDDDLGGGPGTDRLVADGDARFRDLLGCGGGDDRAEADLVDRVQSGCELVDLPSLPAVPPVTPPVIPIPVPPVRRAPVVDAGADTATVPENGTVVLAPGLGVTDADSTSLTGATVTLLGPGPGGETLALPGSHPGISATYAGDTLTLAGSATTDAYRQALRDVTFATTTDAPAAAPRAIRLTVLDDTPGTPLTGSATVSVAVQAVDDAPVVTAPQTASTDEDVPATFALAGGNPVAVSDPDAGSSPVEVSLAATRGTVLLGSTGGVTVTSGADGSGAVTIRGPLPAVDDALAGLAYRPPADGSGTAVLTVGVDDLGGTGSGGPLTDAATIALAVAAVNDAPTATAPAAVTLAEDTSVSFVAGSGSALSLADVDAADAPVTLTLTGTPGTVHLGGTNAVTATGQDTGQVTATGTVSALRTALDGTTYTPALDHAGPAEVRLTVDDGGGTGSGGARTASASTAITVSAVNDAPTLVADPTILTLDEDGQRSAAGTSVADVDADTMRVAVAVQHGRLSFGAFPGGVACSATTAPATLTAEGSPRAVNAQLATLRYCPDADFHGADALQVDATDLGGTGAGGPQATTLSVPVAVASVNDAPSGADRTLTLLEDGSRTLGAADLGYADPADGDALLAVTLTDVPAPAAGVLRLAGAPVTAGQSVPAGSLSSLVLTPAADANGAGLATVGFRVRDDGGTGDGGVDTDPTDHTITFDVTPVNDAPSFTRGSDLTGVLDQDDAGQATAYTIPGWATAISAGPGEDGQALAFTVTTTDDSLFAVAPSVSPNGVLTFTPDPAKAGTAQLTVRLRDDGGTADGGVDTSAPQVATITTVVPGPAITSVSPAPLVPGASAVITGRRFSPTAGDDVVTIGGAAAPVTAASATSLTVTVPCVSSGDVGVAATVAGTATNTVTQPLLVPQRALAVGESAIVDDAAQVGCNEIASAGGDARYVIAAYNTATSPSSSAGIRLTASAPGDVPERPAGRPSNELTGPGAITADAVAGQAPDDGLEAVPDGDEPLRLLDENRRQYTRLRAIFGTAGVPHRGQQDRVASDAPLTRTIRVSNINTSNVCNSYYVARATRVYAEGKLVIYEDDATPATLKAANNPAMATYYDQIGDQFNADMEPIIRTNFGDVLRRDAVTDHNGVMIAFSTPRINTSFSGVAGFVVTCDQFPNDDTATPAVGGPYTGSATNGASNFGEFFYMYQPTVAGTGYSGATPDNWYRTIRATFIHESKHVASQAARVANDAPAYEASWLEEGTARHAEELWARQSVYGVPWKGNTGYGSAAAPGSIYCDLRPGDAACDSLPRRPVTIMQRHFGSLYTFLFGQNSRLLSPYGATPSDNASYYYAISWSLVRYAIDRYGTSDAAFLTALTQSTTTGTTNLSQRTGVSDARLLGGWSLALSVDDYPGLPGAGPDVSMPTWNMRSIYAGLNQDLPATYTLPYPSVPAAHAIDKSFTTDVTTLRGGAPILFQLAGNQTKAKLLRLQGSGGTALPPSIRLALVRVG